MTFTLPWEPSQGASKLRIWLFNVMETGELGDLKLRANWDCHHNYKSREGNSAALLLEYDAVVWRTQQSINSDSERDRQLDVFLADESKVFVFLFDQCEEFPNVLIRLFHDQDSTVITSMRTNKSGIDLKLTPFGQISPFLEYLTEGCSRWNVAFPPTEALVPLALDAEGEVVAFTLSRCRNRAFFLPAPTNDRQKRILLEDLLEAVSRASDREEPAPTWSDKFWLPGMDELQTEISQRDSEIARLQSETVRSQSQLDQLKSVRNALLCADGRRLELAVTEVLNALGYKPKTGPKGQEDVTFEQSTSRFLAEIKGATSSASEGHIKQLHAKQTLYIEQNGMDVKGVLIINAYRQYEPIQRENEGRVVFPHAMMKLVQIWRFCLMTTPQLFEIYRRHLKGCLDTGRLAREIESTVGVLNGYDLPS